MTDFLKLIGTAVMIVAVVLATFLWFIPAMGEAASATPTMAEGEKVLATTTLEAMAVLASPSASLMPSATPSATPDWALATAVSFVATETERVRVVELEISRNNARFADAQSTANAIRLTEIVLTSTAAPLSGTSTLAAQQTEIAESVAIRTADVFALTATPLAAKGDAEAKAAPYLAGGQVFAIFAAGVLALVFAGVAVGAIRRPPAAVTVMEKPVIHVEKDDGGTARVENPPYSNYEDFIDWCAAVVAGETVAVDYWEESGRFVGNYRKTHSWLVRWKLIMRHPTSGKAVLNPTGERVLTKWMVSNPLPHAGGLPKRAPLPTVHTESVHTEAEGERLATDFFTDSRMGADDEADD